MKRLEGQIAIVTGGQEELVKEFVTYFVKKGPSLPYGMY